MKDKILRLLDGLAAEIRDKYKSRLWPPNTPWEWLEYRWFCLLGYICALPVFVRLYSGGSFVETLRLAKKIYLIEKFSERGERSKTWMSK